jgi:hypothetical protein
MPSYTNITATTSSKTENISYPDILRAVEHRDKMSFLKLMWSVSADSATNSQHLESLEDERQIIKKDLESFSLALTALQNSPAKDLTEEQQTQRINICKELEESTNKLKKNLENLDRRITYLKDTNEDMQEKFRNTMSKHLLNIDHINDEKVNIILDYLKQQGIKIDNPDLNLKNILKETLNNPQLQEAYLKSVGQTESKSFTQKLKGWFSS